MKKNILFILGLVCVAVLAACSSKENSDVENDGKIAMSADQFTLTEESYGDGNEVESRAIEQLPAPQTVDLGNGVEAEMSIEREKKDTAYRPVTRVEMSNQHYTIQAFDLSGNLMGTLKGTVSGSGATKKFIPDTGTPDKMLLPSGTYSFLCFNDKVTDVPPSDCSITHADAKDALFARALLPISGARYQVKFEMKRFANRIRVEMKTYWDITGVKATLNLVNGYLKYTSDKPMGANSSFTAGPVASPEFAFPNATTEASDYTYTSTSDYQYFLSGVSTNNNIQIRFTSGSLYGRSIAGRTLTLGGFPRALLSPNESYKVKIKLYYSYRYLFQDGTTATLVQGRAAGKTPVGACTIGNRAIALRNIGAHAWGPSASQWDNVAHSENLNDHKSVIWGWELTYNANQSYDNVTTKASSTRYPAFYWASRYNPGVSTTNLGHWYLPSLGEMLDAYVAIGKFDKTSITGSWGDYTKDWNGKLYRVVFVQAGGTSALGEWCWTSQEYNQSSAVNCGCTNSFIRLSSYTKNSAGNLVRPFIKYN